MLLRHLGNPITGTCFLLAAAEYNLNHSSETFTYVCECIFRSRSLDEWLFSFIPIRLFIRVGTKNEPKTYQIHQRTGTNIEMYNTEQITRAYHKVTFLFTFCSPPALVWFCIRRTFIHGFYHTHTNNIQAAKRISKNVVFSLLILYAMIFFLVYTCNYICFHLYAFDSIHVCRWNFSHAGFTFTTWIQNEMSVRKKKKRKRKKKHLAMQHQDTHRPKWSFLLHCPGKCLWYLMFFLFFLLSLFPRVFYPWDGKYDCVHSIEWTE